MSYKIFFSILSAVIVTVAYFPYFKDILSLKTKPHLYSWLIWIITQSTAIAGMWLGGASWGLFSVFVGTIMVTIVFLFSFKYGTKNITKEDTVILIAALLAILVWWQLDQPVLSIIMVTVIDVLGYLPTFRKSYHEPWSETLATWQMFVISNVFAILSLSQYNLLSATYIISITVANISLLAFCYFRRLYIPKPQSPTD